MSSRHGTPLPSHLHDQDLNNELFVGANPYDEYGPYDMDFTMAAPRSPPIPYDDPYSDTYKAEPSIPDSEQSSPNTSKPVGQYISRQHDRDRGRGRRPGKGRQRADRQPERGAGDRGRGRGRGRKEHRREDGDRSHGAGPMRPPGGSVEPYDPHLPWPLTPTPSAVTQATGQYSDGLIMSGAYPMGGGWAYQQPHPYPQAPFNFDPRGYQAQYIQPHINPLFASAFGINVPSPAYAHFRPSEIGSNPPSQDWTQEWTVNTRPEAEGSDSTGSNRAT